MSDLELLHDYAHANSQTAFTELVHRHLDLVYSAALRQVRSPQLAEEIAQSVFLDLARHAEKISPAQPIAAWLYVVTRRTAVDALRREVRRLARESTAAEIAVMNNTSPETWSKVEASIDEAMATLNDADRAALVLRFFKNLSLSEVGASLGISEDTAQKRVSRALDRLRTFHAGRGIAVSSTTFASTLAAHAVQAAPAGLAAAISTSTLALPAVTLAVAKQVAMTTTQKIASTVALAAAFSFAVYETVPALRLRAQVRANEAELAHLADSARQIRAEQLAAARQLALLDQGRATARSPEQERDAALEKAAAEWAGRIAQLKQMLAQHPELAIPEMQLLTESDWTSAARIAFSRGEESIFQSLRLLRTNVKMQFVKIVADSIGKYFATTHALPTSFEQLAPFSDPSLAPVIFSHYDFQAHPNAVVIAEKLAGAIDPDSLAVYTYDSDGKGFGSFSMTENIVERAVREAAQAYILAHAGVRPTDPGQLEPLLSRLIEKEILTGIFRRLPTSHPSVPPPPYP